MEEAKKALKNYCKALEELAEIEKKPTVKEYLKLTNKVIEMKGALEMIARTTKETFEDDKVQVLAIRAYRKWFDYGIAMKNANPEEKELIDAITSKLIDKEKMNALLEEEKIRRVVAQKSYQEKELSTRAKINIKQNDRKEN